MEVLPVAPGSHYSCHPAASSAPAIVLKGLYDIGLGNDVGGSLLSYLQPRFYGVASAFSFAPTHMVKVGASGDNVGWKVEGVVHAVITAPFRCQNQALVC